MSDEISPEQHLADHVAWRAIEPELKAFIEERRKNREFWERIRQQVVGGVILGAIGAIGTFLYWLGGLVMHIISNGNTH